MSGKASLIIADPPTANAVRKGGTASFVAHATEPPVNRNVAIFGKREYAVPTSAALPANRRHVLSRMLIQSSRRVAKVFRRVEAKQGREGGG